MCGASACTSSRQSRVRPGPSASLQRPPLRGDSPALLGAPEAHPSRCARARRFAGINLACHGGRTTFASGLRQAPGRKGDLCGGEKRKAGGGTRSVLRPHARRSCLSGGRAAHAASSAALPRHEPRSGVVAQRPPAQCEPVRPGAWCKPACRSKHEQRRGAKNHATR